MRRLLFTSGFIACVLFAGPFALRAEPTNAPTPEPQAARRPLPPTGLNAGQGPGIAGIAIGVMTDEQRVSYRGALREMHGQMAELDSKLRAARQDLLDTSVTGKFDENLVRQKALASARIEAELAVLRAKALSQVQPPLSPEQIEKIKSSQSGPIERPFEHPRRQPPGATNHDENGLPPKR